MCAGTHTHVPHVHSCGPLFGSFSNEHVHVLDGGGFAFALWRRLWSSYDPFLHFFYTLQRAGAHCNKLQFTGFALWRRLWSSTWSLLAFNVDAATPCNTLHLLGQGASEAWHDPFSHPPWIRAVFTTLLTSERARERKQERERMRV